jgi:hypothetical protein
MTLLLAFSLGNGRLFARELVVEKMKQSEFRKNPQPVRHYTIKNTGRQVGFYLFFRFLLLFCYRSNIIKGISPPSHPVFCRNYLEFWCKMGPVIFIARQAGKKE